MQRRAVQRVARRDGAGRNDGRSVEAIDQVRRNDDRRAEVQPVRAGLPVRCAGYGGTEVVAGAVEMRRAHRQAVGQLIQRPCADGVPLEVGRPRPFTAGRREIVVGGAVRVADAPVVVHVEHQRVGDAALQVVLEPTRETAGEREVVAAAVAREVRDLPVLRIRTAETRVDVVAGVRIVEQVWIVAARIAIPLPAHDVGLDLELGRQNARRLRRQRNLAGEDVAGRDAARRIGRESRPPVVVERREREAVVQLLAVGDIRHRRGEVQAAAAANDEVAAAAEVVGKAAAGREVLVIVDVLHEPEIAADVAVIDRNRSLDDAGRRRRSPIVVPAQAVVERQLRGRAPHVAEPERERRSRDVVVPRIAAAAARIRVEIEALDDGVESAEIPGGGIVPLADREPPIHFRR